MRGIISKQLGFNSRRVKIILDICDKILLKNVDHHLRLNQNQIQLNLNFKNEIISSELTKLLVKKT